MLGDLSRLANETGTPVADSPVTPGIVAELIALVEAETINSKIAKDVLERMWHGDGSPKAIVEREGLAQTSDPGAIEAFVDDVLCGAIRRASRDYSAGKANVVGFSSGKS